MSDREFSRLDHTVTDTVFLLKQNTVIYEKVNVNKLGVRSTIFGLIPVYPLRNQ